MNALEVLSADIGLPARACTAFECIGTFFLSPKFCEEGVIRE